MKTVEELVSQWTQEEREKLKELIEESREREKKLSESSKRNDENLTKLDASLNAFLSSLKEIKETSEKVADDVYGIYLRLYRSPMAHS